MDYRKSVIYEIYNLHYDVVYVGSTTQALSKRLEWHRANLNSRCKMGPYHHNYTPYDNEIYYGHISHNRREMSLTMYAAMREHGIGYFSIRILENFPCESKAQLRAREDYHITIIAEQEYQRMHEIMDECIRKKRLYDQRRALHWVAEDVEDNEEEEFARERERGIAEYWAVREERKRMEEANADFEDPDGRWQNPNWR